MNAKSLGRILFFILFAILLASVIIYFAQPDYPIRRAIKNTDGKSIDALIVGKITNTVYLKRMPDRTLFSLTLDNLAFRDRVLLTILRDQTPPPVAAPKPKFEDIYIRNRIKKIGELKEKVTVMEVEYNSGTLNPVLQQDYDRRIDLLKNEIKTLEVAIETHRYRLKKD